MKAFGQATTNSTNSQIKVLAYSDEDLAAIVGRMVYMDLTVDGNDYRSIGTISEIRTENRSLQDGALTSLTARGDSRVSLSTPDIRYTQFNIQATFRFNKDMTVWEQSSSSLPTSPSTSQKVHLLTPEIAYEMVGGKDYPSVGYFRGLDKVPQPLDIQDFNTSRGAFHVSVIGKSGSGKSQVAAMIIGAQMKHEQHAIIVIDPQGQWGNENGMIFSPQTFAKGLGREVHVLKVAEDIRLPLDDEILSRMVQKLNPFRKGFRKMGKESLMLFSDVVIDLLSRSSVSEFNEPRPLLTKIFADIATSKALMDRVYVSGGDARKSLERDLRLLSGLPIEDPETGEHEIIDANLEYEVERSWESVLAVFTPLLNLFSPKNISGSDRKGLDGPGGFMAKALQVRNASSDPAPYIILDMSPNSLANAQRALLRGENIKDNPEAQRAKLQLDMQKILDNEDIKALIISVLLDEVKRAAETAFDNAGGANLNTQILFDEAWRYAPDKSNSLEISELSEKLEGFAKDTRKFGIGWTYILQSPADLRTGIWKQLSLVIAGYGLAGGDVKMLESLVDDEAQINLYRGFIPPNSTQVYPFMLIGPISPLIFTNSPTFLDAFNGNEEFLTHNAKWIKEISAKRALPEVTLEYLARGISKKKIVSSEDAAGKSFTVGKSKAMKTSVPQTARKINEPPVKEEKPKTDKIVDDFPF